MTGSPVRALVVVLACAWLGCAPGGLLRVEYPGPAGQSRMVELPRGASEAEVRAELGGPNAIQRSVIAGVVHWLYTFDRARFNYVLEFRGGRLATIRYQPRPTAVF